MAQRSKRHHYVPQALQAQFLDDEGMLWYAERGKDGSFSCPDRRTPYGAFWKKNYYTVRGPDGPSDVVEREHYGPIDDYVGKVVPHVVSLLFTGEMPKFEKDALSSLQRCILHMIRRSPDFLKAFPNDLQIGRDFEKKLSRKLIQINDTAQLAEFKKEMSDDRRAAAQGRDVRVRATIADMPKTEQMVSTLVPKFVVSITKHSYVLPSAMVYRVGQGFQDPKVEIWMPINPKIVIVLASADAYNGSDFYIDTPEHIRHVNEFAVANCGAIATSSQRLIESLIGKKACSP